MSLPPRRPAVEVAEVDERVGRPCDRGLLDDAIAILTRGQDMTTLVHGDFHCGNVLRAEREPWLAIDPWPIAAEPHCDAGRLICDRGPDEVMPDRGTLARRVDIVATALDLDRTRCVDWAFAGSVVQGVFAVEIGARTTAAHAFEFAERFRTLSRR